MQILIQVKPSIELFFIYDINISLNLINSDCVLLLTYKYDKIFAAVSAGKSSLFTKFPTCIMDS